MLNAPESAIPVNQPVTVTVDPGERAVIEYEPVQRSAGEFVVPILGISKYPEMSYEVKFDGETRFGPARIPPTDTDDTAQTFYPPRRFDESLKAIVTNLDGSTTRTVTVQPVGWEEVGNGGAA